MYNCRFGGIVNLTLRFTTNQMISISILQTFRGIWGFYLSAYAIHPSLLLKWLFYSEGQVTFTVNYSNRDTPLNAWNRHSKSFLVDTGILFSNMKSPSHSRVFNDFLTLNQLQSLWLPVTFNFSHAFQHIYTRNQWKRNTCISDIFQSWTCSSNFCFHQTTELYIFY